MRLRTATHRAGTAALTAGVVAVGALALPASASAASDVTLRVTISSGDSVVANVSDKGATHRFNCTLNVTVGVTKDIHVMAPKGASIQVFPSNHCYNAMSPILRTTVDHDGQVIELKL